MIKYVYILLIFAASAACSTVGEHDGKKGIEIRLAQGIFSTRLVDDDNLSSEQVINNISVFFADPGDDNIAYKYIFSGFSTSGDYRIVTIPLEAEELQRKDIYVVANYDNAAALEAVTTITRLGQLQTPIIDKSNNLQAGDGFCMYGMRADFDFTDPTLGSPVVNVERTCAKMRITVTFPGNPRLSTDNSYLVARAASYTFLAENTGQSLPSDAYFNFASETELTPSGAMFTGTAYVYQAEVAPVLYIYTHINGSAEAQEFSANMPIPDRNYLYDLDVRIFEDLVSGRSAPVGFYAEITLIVYDAYGEKIDEVILSA
ncbi:MAG: hypothetical protein LIO77_06750 [Rikenellaceae bacterium]|nr:hypothetical protein [Rikenellaceae bacterium]